jgi:putative effector of murein hydrolase
MARKLPRTKVICIESMLLEKIPLGTIADTLKVSYNAVYYHKQRLDLLALVLTVALAVPLGRKRAFGPGIDEVL